MTISDLLPASFLKAPSGWPASLEWPPPVPSLGPGPEKRSPKDIRSSLQAGVAIGNPVPRAAESGILLWFGHLDLSHEISQDLGDQQGSYWHGLMHRREPDHANAAYWFRRVGTHPVFASLAEVLAQGAWNNAALASKASRRSAWDPYWMNDLCEQARNGKSASLTEELEALQWAEYHLLLRDCLS